MLTIVPMLIALIMATASGFCNSEPMSKVNRIGIIEKRDVSAVMMIALNLLIPPVWIASISGIPPFLNSLIRSIFRMESVRITPIVTTIPMALIRFNVCPVSQSTTKVKAISIGISINTINGWRKFSNWDARMKYINRIDINNIIINSFSICRLEKKLPENATSHPPSCRTVCTAVSISFSGCLES